MGVEELRQRYDEQVHFVLLYVREPHPGQGQFTEITQPTTYEERLQLACRTQEELGITSRMLIDEIDNRYRAAFGGLPNSAYIIGQDGRVFHKQPWMSAKSLEQPLEALLSQGGRGGEKPPQFATGATMPRGSRPLGEAKPLDSYKDAPVTIPAGSETEITWATNLDKAKTLAREAGVPVLVEFYFDSCAFCAAMAKGPLRDSKVVELSRKFVCVKLDLETDAAAKLAERLELIGSPAFAVYNADGEVVLKHTSYAEADVVAEFLRDGLERSQSTPRDALGGEKSSERGTEIRSAREGEAAKDGEKSQRGTETRSAREGEAAKDGEKPQRSPLAPRAGNGQAGAAQPLAPAAQQVVERFAKAAPKVGDLVPDLTAYDADGKEFKLQSLEGHYTVLVFGCLT